MGRACTTSTRAARRSRGHSIARWWRSWACVIWGWGAGTTPWYARRGCPRRSRKRSSSCFPIRRPCSRARTASGAMRAASRGGSRTFSENGRGSRESTPHALSDFVVRRPRLRPGRPVVQLAHPPHPALPHPLPSFISQRGARRGARGRAGVPTARDRAASASWRGGHHAGRRYRRLERVHERRAYEPDHDLRGPTGRRSWPVVLRQLAASRHHARACARLSPRPYERDLATAPGRVRPSSGTVSERVSTELGDRRIGDVLRVQVHERRAGAGKLPHTAPGGGSSRRVVTLTVGRDAVHALARRARPLRLRQPLPSLSGWNGG